MEGTRPCLGVRGPSLQDPVLSSPALYKEEMDMSVSEGPSLGRYFWLDGFYFLPLTKLLSNKLYVIVVGK